MNLIMKKKELIDLITLIFVGLVDLNNKLKVYDYLLEEIVLKIMDSFLNKIVIEIM